MAARRRSCLPPRGGVGIIWSGGVGLLQRLGTLRCETDPSLSARTRSFPVAVPLFSGYFPVTFWLLSRCFCVPEPLRVGDFGGVEFSHSMR